MNNYKKVSDARRFSVITNMSRCCFCGKPREEIHEVFGGCYREKSKAYGMCVGLCHYDHQMVTENKTWSERKGIKKVKGELTMNQMLKLQAQETFEETHSRDEFIQIFGQSYIGVIDGR